ncbi:MAG: Dabb family protein [Clostridia bacterium]|nr:Dabb family protein [Clostridia bacterium]
MVKHIILWKLKSGLSDAEKKDVSAGIKRGLDGLAGVFPGLISIRVRSGCEGSSADLMLDSSFEDRSALESYRTDPRHVEVADRYVRPFIDVRLCMDYVVEDHEG